MPEGDSVAGDALRLDPLLRGQVVVRVECRWPRVVSGLTGCSIGSVMARGKHLLLGFSDGTTLRVHRRMTGSWRVYAPDQRWGRSRGGLAVALHTTDHQVVCFRAPEVERIDNRALATHRMLSLLGPDLIADDWQPDTVLARARFASHTQVADLLRDQKVACGLGNVYASELPFLQRCSPFSSPSALSDEDLVALYERGRRLLQVNVGRKRNTTGFERPHLWVYGRGRRPCLRCGQRIRNTTGGQADRTVYWCGRCQPSPDR